MGVLITSSAIFNIILIDFYVYSIPKAHIYLYVRCQGRQFWDQENIKETFKQQTLYTVLFLQSLNNIFYS